LKGKEFVAKRAVCNTCDGPKLEDVHDCTYFKIGTEKPYPDRNTVIVKAYDFRVYKDEKDFRNEIIDLSTCRPECPHYKKLPISEPVKPVIQEAPAIAKPVTSSIPFGLKIWTLLPAIPITGLGIYGLIEEIRHWYKTDIWDETGVGIATAILAVAFSIVLLNRLLLKGKTWAFSLYKLLIVLTGLGWVILFLAIMKSELWSLPREFIGIFFISYILVGSIISMVVLFSKLPKIKALLYPEKAGVKTLFSRAKGRLLKGDVIVFFLIIFAIVGLVLSSKNNKRDVQPLHEPEKPVKAPAQVPEPPEYAPFPALEAPAPELEPAPAPELEPAPAPENPQIPIPTDTQETISRYLKLGNAFHEEGNYDRAIEMFNRVLNIESDNKDALEGKERAEQANEAEKRVLGR
jgi:hypothetical protein